MPITHIVAAGVPEPIRPGLARLRDSLGIPAEFAPDVLAEAEQAARSPRLPDLDRTDIEFVTIDPEGSMDLDQALHIERAGDGYTVHYAIADVASWVRPGGLVDQEAHRRGQTMYAPGERASLHPPALSEAAASLLADGAARPALLWTITLDSAGAKTEARVERAAVRSRAKLTYEGVQRDLDQGTASESLTLLREVGQLREQQEIDRGGVSLNLPEQEVDVVDGQWELSFRQALPVEGWNAQISLLTGNAAAEMMLAGKIGLLRTLPPAEQYAVDRLRRTAKALKLSWPGSMPYAEFVRSLDPSKPAAQAMLTACTVMFRGAGYFGFDGEVPEGNVLHGALAMPYAHTTAPLRRLADRYVGEVCVALCAGAEVPGWARTELATLPQVMKESDQRAKKYERGIVDLTEALVLQAHVGKPFRGSIIEVDERKGQGIVHVLSPAVEAPVRGKRLPLGEETTVRLAEADVATGRVVFDAV